MIYKSEILVTDTHTYDDKVVDVISANGPRHFDQRYSDDDVVHFVNDGRWVLPSICVTRNVEVEEIATRHTINSGRSQTAVVEMHDRERMLVDLADKFLLNNEERAELIHALIRKWNLQDIFLAR